MFIAGVDFPLFQALYPQYYPELTRSLRWYDTYVPSWSADPAVWTSTEGETIRQQVEQSMFEHIFGLVSYEMYRDSVPPGSLSVVYVPLSYTVDFETIIRAVAALPDSHEYIAACKKNVLRRMHGKPQPTSVPQRNAYQKLRNCSIQCIDEIRHASAQLHALPNVVCRAYGRGQLRLIFNHDVETSQRLMEQEFNLLAEPTFVYGWDRGIMYLENGKRVQVRQMGESRPEYLVEVELAVRRRKLALLL